jgi:hypothetical protein
MSMLATKHLTTHFKSKPPSQVKIFDQIGLRSAVSNGYLSSDGEGVSHARGKMLGEAQTVS